MPKRTFKASDWGAPVVFKPGSRPKRAKQVRVEDNQLRPSVLSYLAWKYPGVRPYVAKDGNTKGQGNAFAGNKRGHPDLIIYCESPFKTLFLELKKEGVSLRQKRQPQRWANEHIAEQAEYLRFLRECGHAAVFVVGYAEAVRIIDLHMAGEDVNALSNHPLV